MGIRVAGIVVAAVSLVAAAAQAQTGAIAGTVKDATGGVLPGVTVEASSPALIEKVRSVSTDGQGVYTINELRPGTYTVTFALAGFGLIKREGIEITTNFTANVNTELSVGDVQETLTVTGGVPTVDVRNAVKQSVFDRSVIENLPTTKGFGSVSILIPGVKQAQLPDVGGTSGETYFYMGVHGGKPADQHIMYDGLNANNVHADGAANGYTLFVNPEAVQEMVVVTDNIGAEKAEGGVLLNAVPKDGGNTLHGTLVANGAKEGMQSNNLTQDLIDAGLKDVNRSINVFDLNGSIGGPVLKDKLWFFNATRQWGYESYVAGVYFAKDPTAWVPNPDPERQFVNSQHQRSIYDRLTWQITPKNKLSLSYDNQVQDSPHGTLNNNPAQTNTGAATAITGIVQVAATAGGTASPETATHGRSEPNYTMQAKWSAPLSNRLLLEAGGTFTDYVSMAYYLPGVDENTISVLDQATNYRYRAAASYRNQHTCCSFGSHMYHGRSVVSYVTGSHALKGGVLFSTGRQLASTNVNRDILYTFNNGTPLSLTLNATPFEQQNSFHDVDIFLQDQWVWNRLTINPGVLYSHIVAQADAVDLRAGTYVPARSYPEVRNLPTWHDVVPRLTVAYDLFGTGKTAVKVGMNKYLRSITTSIATIGNPQSTVVPRANRTWTDGNNDYVPNCEMLNAVANGECGPLSPNTFGTQVVNSSLDTDFTEGFGKRGFNWGFNTGVQQQIGPSTSIAVDYYRRWYGNLTVVNNTLAGPGNYSEYCVTAPVDARLPAEVSGAPICGLYDINPTSFGKVFTTQTFAKSFGNMSDVFNGVDVTIRTRIRGGGFVQGGVSWGKEHFDNCDVNSKTSNPSAGGSAAGFVTRFCSWDSNPFFQTNLNLSASYALPYGVQASATFRSVPGPQVLATATFTNAQIAPSLGRNLSAGLNGTPQVELIRPGTMFGDRLNELDTRFARKWKVGRITWEGDLDLYNITNAAPVTALTIAYGSNWLRPTNLLGGRLAKVGLRLGF